MSTLSPSPHTPLIAGLSGIAHRYDGFILDLFGVVHNGVELYPGTLDCLEAMRSRGKKTVLLSNTPKRASSSTKDLEGIGIPQDLYTCLITAGDATYNAISEPQDDFHESLGNHCWFLGSDIVKHLTTGLNLTFVDGPHEADFILSAMPDKTGLNDRELENAFKQSIKKDIPMICANPDLVVHIGEDMHYCAGHYARLYEDLGGFVAYHGKPYGAVYKMALKAMDMHDKSKVLAIGDSLHTDIQGANNYGISSILNLIGIHREELLSGPDDDIDMEQVSLVLKNSAYRPQMVMAGLKW